MRSDRKLLFRFSHRELKIVPGDAVPVCRAQAGQPAFENLQQLSKKTNWLRTPFFGEAVSENGGLCQREIACLPRLVKSLAFPLFSCS